MAGMLSGVELARRRRTNQHRHNHNHRHQYESSYSRELSVHQKIEPSTNMDETALLARKRLEEKLRSFSAPSRFSKRLPSKGEKSFSHLTHVKETHTSTRRQGKQSFQLDRKNSQREVCSICLEDFQAEQQIMNLPCCHKYHSDCLLPWLTTNSHCPYCRTNVNYSP
ncbi:hypothetical protein IFM89_013737 [Coptis chinensis]|uniref:RING-type domain-containing protein n=1 Tax=Coptis chinensis TaxID=261450 RepID=A0A835HVP7_9MAGN|nr:hypothetical protein IFM89_013737 [Coptis chinensis]